MIYPSADKLENWGSKYSLVVLAAKRAKQIKSGAPPLIPTTSKNPLTIALEEIAAGVVLCQVADHDVLPKTSQETEVAQLLAIPTASAEDEDEELEVEAAEDDEEEIEAEDEEEEIETPDDTEEELESEDDEDEVKPVFFDIEAEEEGVDLEDEAELADEEEPEAELVAEEEPELEVAKEKAKPKRTRKKAEPEAALAEDAAEAEADED
ncbi:MAG: DNA-directed RNA polymerase subunit omega [Armatimonadota bacterium]|jgi:DNA-directed RNA polymerase subunit omega